jgi:hypothetical protein
MNLKARIEKLTQRASQIETGKSKYALPSGVAREILMQRLEAMHDKQVVFYAEQGIDPPIVAPEAIDEVMQGVVERADRTIKRYHP